MIPAMLILDKNPELRLDVISSNTIPFSRFLYTRLEHAKSQLERIFFWDCHDTRWGPLGMS